MSSAKINESSEHFQICNIPEELKHYLIPFKGYGNIRYLFSPETSVDHLKNTFDSKRFQIVEFTNWEKSGPVRLHFAVINI